MLRKILESKLGPLSNSEFKEILDLTTMDIKTNRISFSKRTSLNNAVEIAGISLKTLSRGKVA